MNNKQSSYLKITSIRDLGILSENVGYYQNTDKVSINDVVETKQKQDLINGWRPACSKVSFDENIFQVYLNEENIYSSKQDDFEVTNKLIEKLGAKVLLVGGHYMPDIRNLNHFPHQPFLALKKSLSILSSLNGCHIDLLILLNDLKLGVNSNLSMGNRESILSHYKVPYRLVQEIKPYMNHSISTVYFINERKLFLKLNREKKRLLLKGKLNRKIVGKDSQYSFEDNGREEVVISNKKNDPSKGYLRCIGAITRLLKLCNDMGYDSIVQVYPVCSINTVERGVLHARHLYDIDIPILNIYKTFTCFGNGKKEY